MPKIEDFDNHDASQDKFASFKFGDDSMWSLQAKTSGVSGGDPRYTVMGSNISLNLADMDIYRPKSNSVALGVAVDSKSFPYKFMGIQYNANTATGNLDFYFEQKKDQ